MADKLEVILKKLEPLMEKVKMYGGDFLRTWDHPQEEIDALILTAQALETISRTGENKLRRTLARIGEIISEYEVSGIVLGRIGGIVAAAVAVETIKIVHRIREI